MNAHQTIYIVSPEYNNAGQMIFRDNIQPMIKGKNILVLNSSVTTGETLSRTIESVLYYGGAIRGVAAIFSAATSVAGLPVHAIFNHQDIPNYATYPATNCPLCRNRQRLDALVNGFGYSKI